MPKSVRGKKQQETSVEPIEAISEAVALQLSDEEIAYRAYEIFLARGDEPGDEITDWLQAEAELRGASS